MVPMSPEKGGFYIPPEWLRIPDLGWLGLVVMVYGRITFCWLEASE